MRAPPRWLAALALVCVALPLLPALGLALGAAAPPPPLFFGQGPPSWRQLLQSPDGSPGPLLQSMLLALCVASIAIPTGTTLAWLAQRATYRGARLLGLLSLLPLAIPSYILAGTLRQALGPGGAIGSRLGWGTFQGFWPAVLVLSLTTAPYVQLLVAAALRRCGREEEEAARSLGATPWRAFRATVLPRLRPALAFSLLLVQLYVISDFGAVSVLDCRVLTWRLYQAVESARLDIALMISSGVMVLTLPLLLVARQVLGPPQAPGTANPCPPERSALHPAAIGAGLALQLGVVTLGAVIPLVTLLAWIADGLSRGLPFASLTKPLGETLALASLGALATVVLAFGPAWVSARSPGRLPRWLERAVYLTGGFPGILLAFGLMLLALHGARGAGEPAAYAWLLGSGILLLLGYAIRFLGEAFASLRSGAELLDPRLEEAAASLGASPGARFVRVIAPQLSPAIVVAFVLAFAAIVKELPVTLLLGGPLGVQPLSFRVYDRYNEALLHDAGLAGIFVVAISLLALALSVRSLRTA